MALFESVWSTSSPVATTADREGLTELPPTAVDPLDAQILSLLLLGLTDAAVAKHLRLSMRTVQRRVRALMETAAVHTRIQLGWHAARQGWIEPA